MTLPEINAQRRGVSRIRIPPSMDVPMTERIRRIIDTPSMRRLATISQLGLVSLVYPGATHSRLEHSLGVYANSLGLLDHLTSQTGTSQTDTFSSVAQEAFVVAALVHDAGHWPFCHPIEDMGDALSVSGSNPGMTKHENRVEAILRDSEIARCLADDWQCVADDVMAILRPKSFDEREGCQLSRDEVSFFASCLSGPIDIDKLDYLQRDSLHAGVPYGRNFDPERIVAALCVHPHEPKLAIGEKGRTAAEMMVFGRYVMFSEVYWHHTVRAATAMLQRALFALTHETNTPSSSNQEHAPVDLAAWSDLSEPAWVDAFRDATLAQSSPSDLFGPTRQLFKRVAEFNVESGGEVHALLARRPYWWMVACSHRLAESIGAALQRDIDPSHILIDAPPAKLEVDINIDVVTRSGGVMTLGDVSPVASVLANRQFDNHVKRVRVFAPESIRKELWRIDPDVTQWIQTRLIRAAEQTADAIV